MPEKTLFTLAWEKCRSDIYRLTWLIVGAVSFAILFFACAAYYVKMLMDCCSMNPPPVEPLGSQVALVFLGTYYGFITAVQMAFLIYVCVFLLEVAMAYLSILYLYDNKSWSFVNKPVAWFNSVIETIKDRNNQSNEYKREYHSKQEKYYLAEIAKIKNGKKEKPAPKKRTPKKKAALKVANEPVKRADIP